MEARVFRAARALPFTALCAAFLLTGCGNGGGGEPAARPQADAYGDCDRLVDIKGEASWYQAGNSDNVNCAYPADRHICVSGLTITAIDRRDETGDGRVGNFYAQDTSLTPDPYSGVTIYAPSFSPPDLRLAVGDVADILGTFQEFPGPVGQEFDSCKTLPEIGGAMTLRFENGSVTPVTISVKDLASYETARPYIGMLVRVENVTIVGTPSASSNGYTASIKVEGLDHPLLQSDVPRLDDELFDLASVGLDDGSTLSSVTGIVTYFYGFKVAPRSAADLVP